MEPLLQATDLKKSFGSVKALHSASLTLYPGQVLGLLGDNGAGKSTLIKILSGLHRPDSGSLTVRGKDVDFRRYDVAQARKAGIETVYQERSLAEDQPLWRNLFLGRNLKTTFGLIDVKREKAECMALLKDFLGLKGVGLSPDATVSTLSGGERQGLAIARAKYFGAAVTILDEPTTALAVGEVEKVLSFIEELRASGGACLLISHDMGVIMRACTHYALLEHGRVVGTWQKGQVSEEELTRRLSHLEALDA